MASKYALFKTKLNIFKPNTATVMQKIINMYSLSPWPSSETSQPPGLPAADKNPALPLILIAFTPLNCIFMKLSLSIAWGQV